ncbi:MAG: alpha/beta hydrolase [Actinobacteria bacterium]|nr:alpha/beta hydrolase [Actinomycetota bacterium]
MLVVHAEDSRVLSAEDAERMVAEGANVTLVRIPGCGHLVSVERPAELAQALVEFLS